MPHFNPRFPWGKRPYLERFWKNETVYFNPRFPWGKRRCPCQSARNGAGISIHASRGGSDVYRTYANKPDMVISIHASRGGSDSHIKLV